MTNSDERLQSRVVLPHLLNRRSFVAGTVAAGLTAGFASGAIGQQSTPVDSLATPDGGMPVGSPEASPVTAPPEPERIGNLLVVRDQRPVYTDAPERSGPITMVRVGKSNTDFNPSTFAQDYQIPTSYLDPLVWIESVTMAPQPWLASSWEWSADGTVLEYTLRDDVLWHDGEQFTARDVVFSFTVYRDDVYSSAYNLFTNMEKIEAVDDTTVRVTLSTPDGNWIRNASSQLILQREQYGEFWDAQPLGQRTLDGFDWDAAPPVGTGQWIITDFRDSRVKFKRNRDHWFASPWSSELQLDFVSDSASQLAQWVDGSADIAWPIAPADLPAAGVRAGTVYVAETVRTMFAAFNFNNPTRNDPGWLGDLRIRQALSLGIDRSRYANEIWSGFMRPNLPGTIIQPDLLLAGIENPTFDPKEARSRLEEVGFSVQRDDGLLRFADGTALKLDVIVRRGDDPALEQVLNSIAVDLLSVGVILEVRPLSPERFDTVWIDEHSFDLIAFSYSVYPGFTDFDLYGSDWDIRTNIQGFNPGGYRNEKVNRGIERALVATNDEEYISALHAIQRQVNDEDLFALWLGSPLEAVVVKDDIRGFQPNKVWQGWETSRIWRA